VRTGKLNVKRVQQIIAGNEADRITDQTTSKPKRLRYFGDGGGLWLAVSKRDAAGKPLAASYLYRYMLYGKARETGIGSAWDVDLAYAREAARSMRQRVKTQKVDVLDEKREVEAQRRAKRESAKTAAEALAKRKTFRQVAEDLIDSQESGWRNAKHRYQWRQSLASYAYPVLGDMAIEDVKTSHVVDALKPIWLSKTETASRLRGRIERVLDRAKVSELRTGENPARWKGHLEHLLPKKSAVAPVKHHAALPYQDIGAFVAELRQQPGVAARAFEFAILCWSRSGEVIDMRWEELDEAERLWTVPATRMKAGREHRVPLCSRAMQIINEMREIRTWRPSEFVFQGARDGQPLSNMALLMLLRRMGHDELTVHGFRATASSWCAARTRFPAEMRELALAHTVSDKVIAAYQRDDMFEKRRRAAEAWCQFCDAPTATQSSEVTLIGAA
jgi:integrase